MRGIPYLLLLLAAAGTCVSAARAGGSKFDCSERIIRPGVRFDPKLASRLSNENPISLGLARAHVYLMYEVAAEVSSLSLSNRLRATCLRIAERTRKDLIQFFNARLTRLEREGSLSDFYEEFANLNAPLVEAKGRDRLAQDLERPIGAYLRAIHTNLSTKIQDSPWAGYRHLHPALEPWDQSWLRRMKRVACGAFHLESNKIALNLACSPDQLEFYLFHELAHLATNLPGDRMTDLKRESLAWTETFAFMDWFSGAGGRIPPHFASLKANAQALGLEQWVLLTRPKARSEAP